MPSTLRLGFILLIYNVCLPVVLLLSLPGYIVKMIRRGGYSGHLRQRFGFYPKEIDEKLKGGNDAIWVHAVSVGEVLIAVKMIEELKRQRPEQAVVLSTTTSTGMAVAKDRCADMVVIYSPLDFPWIVFAALRRIQPSQLVLVEAEVWPNLVCVAQRKGIPVSLINARLSDRSERRLAAFGFLVRPIYSLLDRVLVQSEDDISRMQNIGVRAEVIQLVGSIKYDLDMASKPELVETLEKELSRLFGGEVRPVLLAGSTHKGEEEMIGKACLKIGGAVPGLFYIVVPRHFERTEKILARLRKAGLRPFLRTDMALEGRGSCRSAIGQYDTLVVNTTGELLAWYFVANIAVIGKSFLSTGGQNPVEAILAGKPVITGPDMSNFASLMRGLEKAGGVRKVADMDELVVAVKEILTEPEEAERMTQAALSVLADHKGATERTAGILLGRG